MTTESRPVFTGSLPVDRWWQHVVVTLSADEQVALNMLADRDRCERQELAARLIAGALADRKLLPLDWAAVRAWRYPAEGEGEKGGADEEGGASPPLPFAHAPRHPFNPAALHPVLPDPFYPFDEEDDEPF